MSELHMDGLRLPRLYGWQHDALEAWRRAGRTGIVEAVTGTGKTMVGVVAIADALAAGQRAAVLVPGKELQAQWTSVLKRSLPGAVRIGLRGDGHADSLATHHVVVSIVNSARSASLDPPGGSLLVGDECHRYASAENRKALDDRFGQRLGLTATLERPDRMDKKVVDYFGTPCFHMGYPQAIADEVTAHFRVAMIGVGMAPDEAVTYASLSKTIGELFKVLVEEHGLPARPFHRFMREVQLLTDGPPTDAQRCAWRFLTAVYERKNLLANSPTKQQLVGALCPAVIAAERTLVFTESIGAAEIIADDLHGQAIKADTIHSDLTASERHAVMSDFATGRLQVLAAPRVLDEGIDVPAADLAIIVAASKTRRQMIQRMGRVLRRKPDNRLARFAILFLEGTTEDPRLGAHEAFLGEITSVADDVSVFQAGNGITPALEFLTRLASDESPGPPRLEGDPPRALSHATVDDEAADVATFLGLAREATPPAPIIEPKIQAPHPSRAITSRSAPSAGERRTGPDSSSGRRDTLRAVFRSSHLMVSRSEIEALDVVLTRIMATCTDEAIIPILRSTSRISQIESMAEANQARLDKLRAAAARRDPPDSDDPQRSPRRQRPSRRSQGPSRPRPPSSAALGERPLTAPGSSIPARHCTSCGFREEACACR